VTEGHRTKIVRHDHVGCHTSRTWPPANGDCGTRFEARCSCGFGQGAICHEHAEVIERGHLADSRAQVISWDPVPLTGKTITDEDLRALFARHCECRPLDLTRTVEDHAAIHDRCGSEEQRVDQEREDAYVRDMYGPIAALLGEALKKKLEPDQ